MQQTAAEQQLVVRKISNAFLIAINEFCECDETVVTCKRRQDAETFRYDFEFGWYRDERLLSEIGALNAEAVKAAMQRFFQAAHDRLARFQFVGLYFARNIHEWVQRVEQELALQDFQEQEAECGGGADDAECRREAKAGRQSGSRFYDTIANNLPFGVIPLGYSERECYGFYQMVEDRLTMTHTLQFVPSDPQLRQLYDFHVVDLGARFVASASDYAFSQLVRDHSEIIPLSPFASLYMRASLLNEAETQVYDYNAMQVYRDEYAIALPLPEQRLDQIAEPNLHSVDSMLGVQQMDARAREDAALQNARGQLERLQMQRSMYASLQQQQEPRAPTGMQRVLQFQRPTRADFLQYIPKSVQMSTISAAPPSYDLQQLRVQYESDVCSTMQLPYIFLKPYAQGGGSDGGGGLQSRNDPSSKLEFSQKMLDDEVRHQHEQFDLLFREMYTRTWRHLDRQLLGTLPFYGAMQPGVRFAMVSSKSDDAVKSLLDYYTAGVLDPVIIRRFLYRNYGIDEDPAKEPPPLPELVLQEKQMQQQHQEKTAAAKASGEAKTKKRKKAGD